ncbi:MAG: GNAT family protein [Pseudomonadota bacterium]
MTDIETRFRPMNESDLEMIAAWFEDFEDVALFDRALPVPVSKEFVAESWKPALQYKEPPSALWFVADTSGQTSMGICGLQGINYIHGDAVIPIFITSEYRHKGLAGVMLCVLLDLAFKQLRLHRISTVYRSDNEPSRQLVARFGFSEEGRVREGWYADGGRHDIVQVGLLRTEWEEARTDVNAYLANSPFKIVKELTL